MPLPRGVDPAKAVLGYVNSLQGFPIEAIAHGIRQFLRGECGEDVSRKFCPHPPELASIIRGTMRQSTALTGGKYHSYKAPKSKIVERKVTKDFARGLVDNGVHPRGCIWCPGDPTERPDIGDLYGADPEWKQPISLTKEHH